MPYFNEVGVSSDLIRQGIAQQMLLICLIGGVNSDLMKHLIVPNRNIAAKAIYDSYKGQTARSLPIVFIKTLKRLFSNPLLNYRSILIGRTIVGTPLQ